MTLPCPWRPGAVPFSEPGCDFHALHYGLQSVGGVAGQSHVAETRDRGGVRQGQGLPGWWFLVVHQ